MHCGSCIYDLCSKCAGTRQDKSAEGESAKEDSKLAADRKTKARKSKPQSQDEEMRKRKEEFLGVFAFEDGEDERRNRKPAARDGPKGKQGGRVTR